MAVLAVAFPAGIQADLTPGLFKLIVYYAGCDPANPLDSAVQVHDLDPTDTAGNIQTAIATAVQTDLVTMHGYTFGGGDTVRVLLAPT